MLNLPMFTVFSAESQADGPRLRMSVFRDGIVVQGKLGDVFLVGDDVALQLKGLVAEVGDKEAVVVGPVPDLAQGGDHLRLVAVADVVFLTPGQPTALVVGEEARLCGVDVRPVRPLRKAEGEDGAVLQKSRRFLFGRFVTAHPDGAKAENGHLEAVPVAEAVKGQQFAEFAVSGRIPAAVGIVGVFLRREQLVEDLLLFQKIEELPVPDAAPVVLRQLGLAHPIFKKIDGLVHDGLRPFVGH